MAEIINSNNEFVESLAEGTERVLTGSFALIAETQTTQTWSDEQFCAIEQIGDKLTTIFHGIAVKKSEAKLKPTKSLVGLFHLIFLYIFLNIEIRGSSSFEFIFTNIQFQTTTSKFQVLFQYFDYSQKKNKTQDF